MLKYITIFFSLMIFFAGCKNKNAIEVLPTYFKVDRIYIKAPQIAFFDDWLVINYRYSPTMDMQSEGTAILKFKDYNQRFEPVLTRMDWDRFIYFETLFLTNDYVITAGSSVSKSKNIKIYQAYTGNLLSEYRGGKLLASDKSIYFENNDSIFARDLETEEEIWSIANSFLHNSLPQNETIFILKDSLILGVDKNTGGKLWQTSLNNRVHHWGINNDLKNRVIVELAEEIILLDSNNGRIIWRINDVKLKSQLTEGDTNYFVILRKQNDMSSFLTSINKDTGKIEWVSKHPTQFDTKPILYNDNIIFSDGNNILICDIKSGEVTKTIKLKTSDYSLYNREYFIYGGSEGGVYQIPITDLVNI